MVDATGPGLSPADMARNEDAATQRENDGSAESQGAADKRDAAESSGSDAGSSSGKSDGGSGGGGGFADTAKSALQDGKAGAIRGATDAAVDKTMGGDPNSAQNQMAKAAVAGAAQGAMAGGAHGAAIGAAKGAAMEGASQAAKKAGLDDAVDTAKKGKDLADKAGKDKGDKDGGDKKLGAGGTSYERSHSGVDSADGSSGGNGKKVAGAALAATAAPAATTGLFFLMLMAWLKTFFFQMLSVALGFWQMLWTGIKTVASAIWQGITAPFAAMGSFFAGAGAVIFGAGSVMASAAAGVTASILAVLMVLAGLFGALFGGFNTDDGGVGATSVVCASGSSSGSGGGDTSMPVSEQTEENAKTVYSVFSSMGMSDANIAGILGNWSVESGVDPTAVFGIYDEKFNIGPAKQAAWDNNFTGLYDGITNGGIGLGQWINGRNQNLLKYADDHNRDWFDLGTQLGFMLSSYEGSDAEIIKDMVSTDIGDPRDAAQHFHDKWERSNNEGVPQRLDAAEGWFAKMSGWTVDEGVVDEVVGDLLDGSEGTSNNLYTPNDCHNGSNDHVSLKDGGLTLEEAQALIDLYNKEGDKFLDDRYGKYGGPGNPREPYCSNPEFLGHHTANCVSFSTYFVNKYTTYQQYPWGNGIDTAYTIAADTGKEMSSTPTAYSVGSGPGSGPAGHTLVVLGVEGNKVIIGEAGYCAFMGRVRETTVAALQDAGWKFVDMSDSLLSDSDLPTDS